MDGQIGKITIEIALYGNRNLQVQAGRSVARGDSAAGWADHR